MTEASIIDRLAGKFIVLDGPDGCGKTTQTEMLARYLGALGARVLRAHDPGGTEIGERIRQVLLGYDLNAMDVRCETFLFMASRAQLVSEVIEPALVDGAIVVCDRFISSTYAYQGAAGYEVSSLMDLGNSAVGDVWPHLTIVIDLPIEQSNARLGGRLDAMESRPRSFHEQVRTLFRELPKMYPGPVSVVDGTGTPDEVHARVVELVQRVDS